MLFAKSFAKFSQSNKAAVGRPTLPKAWAAPAAERSTARRPQRNKKNPATAEGPLPGYGFVRLRYGRASSPVGWPKIKNWKPPPLPPSCILASRILWIRAAVSVRWALL